MVVLFHDLNVVIRAQNRRSALAQLRQHIDAHGHVRAFEHRNGAGQLHHLELQLFRKAGSAYHNGQLVGLAVGQSLFYGRRGAEIDDHIALAVQLFQTVVHGDTVLIAVLQVDAGDHAAVLTLCDHITQHMAHTAANALNHNICHSFYPFLPALHIGISQNAGQSAPPGILQPKTYSVIRPSARRAFSICSLWASLGSTRGRRHSPASQPSTFIAYFTGMGFTSQNSASASGSISNCS